MLGWKNTETVKHQNLIGCCSVFGETCWLKSSRPTNCADLPRTVVGKWVKTTILAVNYLIFRGLGCGLRIYMTFGGFDNIITCFPTQPNSVSRKNTLCSCTLRVFMMSNVVLVSRPVLTLSIRNAAWGPQTISPGTHFHRASNVANQAKHERTSVTIQQQCRPSQDKPITAAHQGDGRPHKQRGASV